MKCRANILLTAYAEAERSSKCKKTWVVQKFSEDVTITPLFFCKNMSAWAPLGATQNTVRLLLIGHIHQWHVP